tara:strand:+ start:1447 stop:1698 length:252 start_codon:yes stop_codon:yes gene_type:complete
MVTAVKDALTSKKFLATIIGALVVAVGSAVGLSEDQATKVAMLICTYVLGQSVADAGKEKEKLKVALADKTGAEKAAALEAEL